MTITEFRHDEVRVRAGSQFSQVPNMVLAGELLADGQFVTLSSPDGTYSKASQDIRATHIVKDAGVPRITADEISNKIGTVQIGEPTMALTGWGSITLPFASNVTNGQTLSVNANGYAVAWTADSGETGAFVIGKANEDVTIEDGETLAWGEAIIDLPAKWSPSTAGE